MNETEHNEKLHKLLGKELQDPCGGDWIDYDGAYCLCEKCGFTLGWYGDEEGDMDNHREIVPDYTKVEIIWPLAWEYNLVILKAKGVAGYLDNVLLHNFIKTLNEKGDFHIVVVPPNTEPGIVMRSVLSNILIEKEGNNDG